MSKEENENSILKFLFGLVPGVISGIVVGLFIAPKAGKQLREDILSKTTELKDLTKDKISEIGEVGKDKAYKVASKIQQGANKIGTRFDEMTKSGSEILMQDEIQ